MSGLMKENKASHWDRISPAEKKIWAIGLIEKFIYKLIFIHETIFTLGPFTLILKVRDII